MRKQFRDFRPGEGLTTGNRDFIVVANHFEPGGRQDLHAFNVEGNYAWTASWDEFGATYDGKDVEPWHPKDLAEVVDMMRRAESGRWDVLPVKDATKMVVSYDVGSSHPSWGKMADAIESAVRLLADTTPTVPPPPPARLVVEEDQEADALLAHAPDEPTEVL